MSSDDPMVSGGSSNSESAPLDVFVRKCFQMDYEVYEFIIPVVVEGSFVYFDRKKRMIISDDSAEETFVLIRDCCGMTFDMLQTAVNFAVQYLTLPLCDLCIRVNHIEGKGGTPETNRWSALSLDLKKEFVRRYGSVWYCSVDRNFVIMGHEQHSSYIDFIVDDIRIVLDGGGVARRLQSPPTD